MHHPGVVRLQTVKYCILRSHATCGRTTTNGACSASLMGNDVEVSMAMLAAVKDTGPAVPQDGPPVRVRLPAGGWQAGFGVRSDGRTVVEVTEP